MDQRTVSNFTPLQRIQALFGLVVVEGICVNRLLRPEEFGEIGHDRVASLEEIPSRKDVRRGMEGRGEYRDDILDFLPLAYEQTEERAILRELITGPLWLTYVILQLLICSLGPFVLLSIAVLFRLPGRAFSLILFVSASLLLLQVLLMRWNVVIGGQLISKSYRGFTGYLPGLFDKEGLLAAGIILVIPFLLIRQFDKIFPFFDTNGRGKDPARIPD